MSGRSTSTAPAPPARRRSASRWPRAGPPSIAIAISSAPFMPGAAHATATAGATWLRSRAPARRDGHARDRGIARPWHPPAPLGQRPRASPLPIHDCRRTGPIDVAAMGRTLTHEHFFTDLTVWGCAPGTAAEQDLERRDHARPPVRAPAPLLEQPE